MFVCICNGHRDSDIREAAKTGMTCARQIYRHLGKPARCGRCLDFAAGVIADTRASLESAATSFAREIPTRAAAR